MRYIHATVNPSLVFSKISFKQNRIHEKQHSEYDQLQNDHCKVVYEVIMTHIDIMES